ncbi:MAG: hypothetical protein NTU57_03570 [Candidatus Aenigmarchaeota archaeon]|nr:hypothetical protein [Candidatus Aenigmarchaeota archaeon]
MKRLATLSIVLVTYTILAILISHAAAAQEGGTEVCLVYFTSYACGDDCSLTDTFMDGLMSEYTGNLTAIVYYTDVQGNANVFQAYRRTYNLPDSVPLVLFGSNNYLLDIDNIYQNTESKILDFIDANGTNCPLDSGYVPPWQVGAGSLPGQAMILTTGGQLKRDDIKKNNTVPADESKENISSGNETDKTENVFELNEPMKETVFSLVIIGIVLMVVAAIIIYVWDKTQESL